MPSLLSMGAGASEGLDNVLQRMLLEAKLKADQENQAGHLAETSRHNLAEEDLQGRQHQLMSTDTQARIREQQARDEAATQDRKSGLLRMRTEMRPIGAMVSPQEKEQEIQGGIPSGLYGQEQPPSMGMSTPTGEVGPSEQGSPWKGTQDQITKAAASGKHGEDKGVVRETEKGLMRIYADGTSEPVVDGQGSTLKGFHAPVQPIVVNTGTGPSLVDRGKGTAKNIIGPDGQPVSAPESAQTKNRRDMADAVGSHFDDVSSLLDEADQKGLLGPMAGRTFVEFMSGKVGSTGNAANDELLGELRTQLGMIRTGVASLHGRTGANVGIAKDIEKKMDEGYMDPAMIRGALKGLKSWVDKYAKKPGGTAAAPAGGDLYEQYLARTAKPK